MSRPANRLAASTSPYLQQHAHNPVDWFPWGEEALAKARREDLPIFLSIGYSACHWCHVMERESFEDEGIATLLNSAFVPVKVDREERPDLDDLYMDAVQLMTGRGGWPMSVWLTPDLKPFYGGTYFPADSRGGMPGFRPLLERISGLWQTRREDVERDGAKMLEVLARQAQVSPGRGVPGAGILDQALDQLRERFDARWGGFTPAPKFPAHMAVDLFLRRGRGGDERLVRRTLDAMWEGGMYDHLGGGFARYSVDGRWLVPHFEKMLYDNALLASCYLDASVALGEPRYAAIARETLAYLIRDLRDPSGGFHCAEDADSEGHEGTFYVWTPGEVRAALGDEADLFMAAYGVTPEGNFEGATVLHRFSAQPAVLGAFGLEGAALEARLTGLRERLRVAREARVRPFRDDKVLAEWNGLALSALARGARILGDGGLLRAAQACATFLRRGLWRDGVLHRVYRRGEVHTPGFLEDYGAVILGLVDLFEADGDPAWLRWAEELADAMRSAFEDREEGAFFSSRAGATDLLFRQKPMFDGATPAANTLAAGALLRLGRHLDRPDFIRASEGVLVAAGPHLERVPGGLLALLGVLDLLHRESEELVVSDGAGAAELWAVANRLYRPELVRSPLRPGSGLPLHEGREATDGRAMAWLCRGNACLPPVGNPAELALLLG